MEIRQTSNSVTGDGNKLSGYAVLYGVESRTLNEYGRTFKETIKRGAFDLENQNTGTDVKLFYNHDSSMPLARTEGGSLRLFNDENGIRFEADLPDTTLANDIKELMKRGILTGEMSFGFSATSDSWDKNKSFRTVEKANLYEISVVVDAAYPQTHSLLRSIDQEINNKRINLIRRKIK